VPFLAASSSKRDASIVLKHQIETHKALSERKYFTMSKDSSCKTVKLFVEMGFKQGLQGLHFTPFALPGFVKSRVWQYYINHLKPFKPTEHSTAPAAT
jgi:hypothetical protein